MRSTQKSTHCVMEVKTGAVLVRGSYDYCKNWIFNHCKYNKKQDVWKDADHEPVTITLV